MTDFDALATGWAPVERNLISEKKILAIKLLETYWQWEYELGVTEKEHKLTQAEAEAINVEEMIAPFFSGVRERMTRESLPEGLYDWASDQLNQIEKTLGSGRAVKQADVKRVVLFIQDFLFRLYPGTTSVVQVEDELAHEQDFAEDIDEGGLYGVSEDEKRREIINPHAQSLYSHRYKWGYFPDAAKGMTHDDRRVLRKGLWKKYFDDQDNDTNLDRIFKKIEHGEANDEEVLLYQTSRNKLTGTWLSGIIGRTEILEALGGEFVKFHVEAQSIDTHLSKIRTMIEEHAMKGGLDSQQEIDGLVAQAKIHIDRADLLMDRVFLALYPEIEDEQTGGINREKLEAILRINKE